MLKYALITKENSISLIYYKNHRLTSLTRLALFYLVHMLVNYILRGFDKMIRQHHMKMF